MLIENLPTHEQTRGKVATLIINDTLNAALTDNSKIKELG
jgi:hypothetical protein